MGLYDTLTFADNHLTVGNSETQWQTKSLDCLLDNYKVNEHGELKHLQVQYEYDPTLETPISRILGEKGDYRVKSEQWVDYDYTGSINFYTSIDDKWVEFEATFLRGNLNLIK